MNKETPLNILLLSASLVFTLVAGELALRFFFADRLSLYQDERNAVFRYDPELGWFPLAYSVATYTGSHPIHVRHNSLGFRDREHPAKTKPRLVFLGDSYVWGFDVEQDERFTDRLAARLPDWDILNIGVSGYGTDQEYMLLQKFFRQLDPDIVFLLFCVSNDIKDNSSNRILYGGYYKPYFESVGDTLLLRGIPVPKSIHFFHATYRTLSGSYLVRALARLYYKIFGVQTVTVPDPTMKLLRQMRRFVESNGAIFLVGLEKPHPPLEAFLDAQQIRYVNLGNPFVYSSQGRHWTPEGHAFASNAVYDFLLQLPAMNKAWTMRNQGVNHP
jgi:hypothetical protein